MKNDNMTPMSVKILKDYIYAPDKILQSDECMIKPKYSEKYLRPESIELDSETADLVNDATLLLRSCGNESMRKH